MKLTKERNGPLLILRPEGEIDHHCAAALTQELTETIDEETAPQVRLDMGGVPFMDSAGLMVVVAACRRAQGLDGAFEAANVMPQPRKVLQAAGLDRKIPFVEG
ncbi:MAG: STAS domain-containing protein [Ruminococcaceae bacterium]|nr:STAS domain-containing protein [Oscillospiraceae bacterium]